MAGEKRPKRQERRFSKFERLVDPILETEAKAPSWYRNADPDSIEK
jgi:hypothetical protein